jgi:DNA-binding transcriptional MerR regulator
MHSRPVKERSKPHPPAPDKLFYKIGEVSRIIEIEPYVLRYWETEFPFLKPRKNKSGQRVYIKKDLETVMYIKRMLYQERYTIEGVRKRFGEGMIISETKALPENKTKDPAELIQIVKKRLRDILAQIK